jgi:trimeric autotransporter adhesin
VSAPLILLLLPLLMLAVVLLFAFGGCHFTPGVLPPEPEPDPYPVVVTNTLGLVAYWRLGEGTLPVARDETANHLDGTYQGGVSLLAVAGALEKSDAADRAPTFDGQDAYVEVATDMRLNPPMSFTVEAWIRPAVGAQGTQHVLACHDVVSGLDFGYELSVIRAPDPAPRIQGRVCTGVASPLAEEVVFLLSDAELVGSDWKHVVPTYDGLAADKPAKLYVDSELKETKTNVAYTQNAAQPLRIAAGRTPQQRAAAGFYAGAIDEVAVYNVALSANAVSEHFHASGR